MSAPPVYNNNVEVYLGKAWVKASDYREAAYLDYLKMETITDQMYYVGGSFLFNQCVKTTYPGIKQIKKNGGAEESSSGNIIFRMKGEKLDPNAVMSASVLYIITDDGRKIPISHRPKLKEFQEAEENKQTDFENQIMEFRRDKGSLYLSSSSSSSSSRGGSKKAGHSKFRKFFDGKRKQKRTNKNKRHTRQTRRYFKR